MMLTMLVGFVLIYTGVDRATGQQQAVNEKAYQNGKKLEIREVSQTDKLKEVQEIPVSEIQIAEEIAEPEVGENPLQQRKVELREVMEDRVASLVKLIEQDKQQVGEKQADQRRQLQKRMEEIQKELGQMFLEYMALREKLAEQTDPVTAQKDEEFLGRVLKLHKEADTVTLEKVEEADKKVSTFYIADDKVKNVAVEVKGEQVVYKIKTSSGAGGDTQAKLMGGVGKPVIVTEKARAGTAGGGGVWIAKSGDVDTQKILAGSGKTIQVVTEEGKGGVLGGQVVLRKLDEETKLQEFVGVTSPIKFLSEKTKEGDQEVSYMIIMSGDNPPKEVCRVVQPVQMRNWQAADGTTSIIIGPAEKQNKDETEVEIKAGTIMLDRLKKDQAQSAAAGRAYAVAVDATQAQTAKAKQALEYQIVTQAKQQEAKNKAELEKKLALLKVELEAINRQVEKKDAQVKLELEMKKLEDVLSQMNKSNAAPGQAVQNYIAVGRSGNVESIKALTDLRKEQNQLKILVDEAKISGDEKKAAELEKLIELFVVHEDQAKAQAEQAQRQYRVATALVRDETEKKVSDTTQITRAFTTTPLKAALSGTQKNGVLVIPSGQPMDAEEYKLVVENMQTMALILKKKQEMGATDASFGLIKSSDYRIYNLAGAAGEVQAIYLKGYGALFLMTVDYPLLAPVEKKVEPKEKAGDVVWEKARQEIKSGKQGVFSIAQGSYLLSTNKKSAQEYNQEKVEKLKQTLLESLRHAGNMGHVDSSEWITIHITGAGQPIVEVIGDIKNDSATEGMLAGITISGDVNLDVTTDQTFMVTKTHPQKGDIETITLNPQKTSEPTYMLIQVQKRDIDRFAEDRMSLEEFIEEVTVLIY